MIFKWWDDEFFRLKRLWFDNIGYDLTIKKYDFTIKNMIWQYRVWFDNIDYYLTI